MSRKFKELKRENENPTPFEAGFAAFKQIHPVRPESEGVVMQALINFNEAYSYAEMEQLKAEMPDEVARHGLGRIIEMLILLEARFREGKQPDTNTATIALWMPQRDTYDAPD